VTQALAAAIDRGDPMGVQGVLGKPGMERGWTRRQEETWGSDGEWRIGGRYEQSWRIHTGNWTDFAEIGG